MRAQERRRRKEATEVNVMIEVNDTTFCLEGSIVDKFFASKALRDDGNDKFLRFMLFVHLNELLNVLA